jgi:hypothetical protein
MLLELIIVRVAGLADRFLHFCVSGWPSVFRTDNSPNEKPTPREEKKRKNKDEKGNVHNV